MLEIEVRKYILEDEKIKGIIGNRIYPDAIPENAPFPAIAYNEITAPSHHDIDVNFPRIQFSCFSHSVTEARSIRKMLKDRLKGFKGYLGNVRTIQIVVAGEYRLDYEPDRNIYGRAIDFKIIYWE